MDAQGTRREIALNKQILLAKFKLSPSCVAFVLQAMDEAVREALVHVNRQLAEHQARTPPPAEANVLELLASTP